MNSHSTTTPSHRRADAVLAEITGQPDRPILLTGGAVVTGNPVMGDWEQADVLIGGSVIVGVGPGLLTAAGDDNMIVIDCAGTLVLPAAPDFTGRGPGATLTPGEAADIAVLRLADAPGTPTGAVPARGTHLDILITAGRVTVWDGRRLDGADDGTPAELPSDPDTPYRGMWADDTDFIRQELRSDGRYDEARGDRETAYQGRYWISGDRIDYLDDLGFWAFGTFENGHLHHAGYRFTKRPNP